MYRLFGEFECKLDQKGRLKLPAGLIKQLGQDASINFTLNRGFEKCLILYPKTVWDDFTAALQKLNPFITKNRDFIRAFYRGATPVNTDKADRILITASLKEHAGLKKDVVVNAYAGFIEIWDKQVYLKKLGQSRSDDLAQQAEEVFASLEGFEFGGND